MNPPLEPTDSRVLVLAPTGRDALLARRVLSEAGIGAHICANLEDLQQGIREGAGAVLVTEDGLSVTAVAELPEVLATHPPSSNLPLLPFSAWQDPLSAPPPPHHP